MLAGSFAAGGTFLTGTPSYGEAALDGSASSCLASVHDHRTGRGGAMFRSVARVLAVAVLFLGWSLASAPVAAAGPPPPIAQCSYDNEPICWELFYNSGSPTYNFECFNAEGTFRAGSRILAVDWNDDGRWDECFGIAPDRRIYHAWPNSVGWDPMPNDGRADDVHQAFLWQGLYRTVQVIVAVDHSQYCSTLMGNPLAWTRWARCYQ